MSESRPLPDPVLELGSGRFLVTTDAGRRLAYGVRVSGFAWVFLDGEVFVIGDRAAASSSTAPDESGALSAPMPATVVAVDVAPGQRVTRGDVLIRLEAMKMELAIRAPRDGGVVAIRCRPGELVQPGIPLVDLE